MSPARLVLWSGLDDWRTEATRIDLTADGITATGTQVGTDPVPYRVDYELNAPERFVTRRFDVRAAGTGWSRRIELTHDGAGAWTCAAEQDGDVDLPPPGGDAATLRDALDCDLGLSPLTNFMPVRRHALHERAGEADFVMAWVSVPDLEVFASAQRYEHVRRDDSTAVVRFVDRGRFAGFTAELELDPDGLVIVYPELARREA
jgi:uncharacterized protein